MNGLIDQGFLEKPLRNSLGLIYVPQLYKQVINDLTNINNVHNDINGILNNSLKRISQNHKEGR